MEKRLKSKGEVVSYENKLGDSLSFVLREADQLYQGHGRLKETLDRLANHLDELGIPYGLIGGYALILHGIRRFTEDIDLLISTEGLNGLHKALIGRGYVRVAAASRNLRDAETGVKIEFVLTGEFPGDGKAKPIAFPDPEKVTQIHDGIKVINLISLIELKLASGMTGKMRLQDLADVQRLIQEHYLTPQFSEKLHPYVRKKFLELLS